MIRKMQEEHKVWQINNFGLLPPEDSLLGIVEEVGELAHAHTHNKQRVRTNENHASNMKDAVGDITIFLMSFCTSYGWDYQSIIEGVWKKVSDRDWVKFPGNGRTE